MTRDGERIVCSSCGQDYQTWYRVRADGRTFLVCPECDSAWLPGDDRYKRAVHWLPDLFPSHQKYDAWDLIEPCDTPDDT